MSRVYVGNLDPRITEHELEDEFRRYGKIRSIWVARKPPGFAFVEYDDLRDAEEAIKKTDGQNGWKVEASRARGAGGGPRGGGGGGGGYGDRGGDRGGRYGDRGGDRGGGGFDRARSREMRCYECNEVGHLARDCRDKGGGGGGGGRGRSPPRRERERYDSPRRDRSYSADRSVSRSPARGRN